uniref:UDP-glucuronosyltransferase n=1 Tax=Strongyloides stercoralis TaxID=6248 RepID=A0AAF5CYC8_STRER
MELMASKSHSVSIHPLAKELVLQGNNVTLLNYGVKSIGMYDGILTKEILFNDTELYDTQIELFGRITWRKPNPSTNQLLGKLVIKYGMYLSKNNDYINLINTKWDAIIVNEALFGQGVLSAIYMKEKNNIPIISLSTTDYTFYQALFRGLERYYLIEGNIYFNGEIEFKPENFYYRFITFINNIKEYNAYFYSISSMNQMIANFINITTSLEKFYSYSSWNIVETFDKLFLPSSLTSSITYTGSSCDSIVKMDNNFDTNLSYFINDEKSKGTIYMAFGSQMPWNWAPITVIKNFINVFKRFNNYKIILSININITNITIPSNVLLVRWAPQTLILNHNKTKLFITHGGLKSFRESICGEVPMLSIPFYIDQTKNSLNGYLLGISERLNRLKLSSNNIYNKIIKILKNQKYKLNIQKLRKIMVDRIINPTEECAYNIKKIIKIKHKYSDSNEFWQITGRKINFMVKYFFDTLIFITFIVVLIL